MAGLMGKPTSNKSQVTIANEEVQLGALLVKTFKTKVEINDEGDVCILFVERKDGTLQRTLNKKNLEG